jgi:hypothetical protein
MPVFLSIIRLVVRPYSGRLGIALSATYEKNKGLCHNAGMPAYIRRNQFWHSHYQVDACGQRLLCLTNGAQGGNTVMLHH